MSKELISQLKKIKDYEGRLNADKAWVKRTRAQMLQQLGNTVPEEKAGFKLENV